MASSQSTELESVDFEKDTVAAGVVVNKFSNDGSFLEMFKKKMEEEQRRKSTESKEKTETADSPDPSASVTETESSEGSKKPSFYSFVGKRRGGAPVLKTGAVKKQKQEKQKECPSEKKDAWSKYLEEVQKYKSQSCQEEDKTRPLVK